MTPEPGSRWIRNQQHDPSKGPLNHYTVLFITNQDNLSCKHPQQVVYRGDNGKLWSLPLEQWPGNLRRLPGTEESLDGMNELSLKPLRVAEALTAMSHKVIHDYLH